MTLDGAALEDLSLYFTVPGHDAVALKSLFRCSSRSLSLARSFPRSLLCVRFLYPYGHGTRKEQTGEGHGEEQGPLLCTLHGWHAVLRMLAPGPCSQGGRARHPVDYRQRGGIHGAAT